MYIHGLQYTTYFLECTSDHHGLSGRTWSILWCLTSSSLILKVIKRCTWVAFGNQTWQCKKSRWENHPFYWWIVPWLTGARSRKERNVDCIIRNEDCTSWNGGWINSKSKRIYIYMPRNMRIRLVQLSTLCVWISLWMVFSLCWTAAILHPTCDADPKALQKHCGDACFNSVNAGIKDRLSRCLSDSFCRYPKPMEPVNLLFRPMEHWVNLGWLYSLVQPNLGYICG